MAEELNMKGHITNQVAHVAAAASLPVQPAFARVPIAVGLYGISRAQLYREAGKGNIVMKKAGRTTLVCLDSLRAYLDALPRAHIRPPLEKGTA
jgi:hypothetical protein